MSRRKVTLIEVFTLLAILLISATTLVYKLEDLPMLHGDEGASGVQAMLFSRESNNDLFRIGWAEQPMLSFAFQSVFQKMFGLNVFGLRSASVFFGLLSIVPFYLFARFFYPLSRSSAIAATCFYSFSHWFIAMSRFGTNYIQIVPFGLFALLFLFLGVRFKRESLFLFSGLLSGIPIYLYHAGRLTPFLIIGSFMLIGHPKQKSSQKKLVSFALLVIGLSLALMPFIQHYLTDPTKFLVRTKDVVIFDKFKDAFFHYNSDSKLEVLLIQFVNTIKIFFVGGDNSEQYGYQGPLIPFLFQPIFILGIFSSLKKSYKEKIWRCILFSFFTILLLGGALTINPYPPFSPRLVGSLPFVFFFLGLGLERVITTKIIKKKYRASTLSLLVLLWIIMNLKIYFGSYVTSLKSGWANYEPATTIGRYLNELGPRWTAVFYGSSKFYATQGNIDYLAYPVRRIGEVDFNQIIKKLSQEKRNTVFIFLPYRIDKERDWWEGYRKNIDKSRPQRLNWQEEKEALLKTFPDGSLNQFFRSDGTDLFWAFEVRESL